MYKYLKVEKEDVFTVITINRPDQLNALNLDVLEELHWVLEEESRDPSILVFTGEGEKAFVAGADIAAMKEMTPLEAEKLSQAGQAVFHKIYQWPLPTVAVINGYALGGGCELALACDLRIIKEGTRIGQPEITLGIIPGFGGTYFLKKVIGEAKAKELILTGKAIKADEAREIGLVNQVLPQENFKGEAFNQVREIGTKGHKALRAAKIILSDNFEQVKSGLERERTLFAELFTTEDQTEGMAAFLEKRKPKFKNK